MRKPGYLQTFDTVNFDPRRIPQDLQRTRERTFVDVHIYSLFYEVRFSPNQVLDLDWLRSDERFRDLIVRSWPYALSVDSQMWETSARFTQQLLSFLRRSGSDAFIFSSKPDNVELAAKWGSFVKREGHRLDDESLLTEAGEMGYEDIVAWVKQLDSLDIQLAKFNTNQKYPQMYRGYLDEADLVVGYLQPTPNRSHAYQLIERRYKDDVPQQRKAKEYPDFISSNIYADGLQARCVLKPDSPFTVPGSTRRSFQLDLQALYDEFPLEETILNADQAKLRRLREKAEPNANRAWESLDDPSKPIEEAKHIAALLLKEYIEALLGLSISDVIRDITVSGSGPRVPLSVPEKFITKFNLRGLDKFILIS